MNRSAWGLAFVLSISGCTCEYHAGTGVSTHAGGERTAADIERERYERERYERERAARDADRAARERAEWERRNNPRRVGGGVHVTGRRTETPIGAPPAAPPISAPPAAAPSAHPNPSSPGVPVGAPPVVHAPPAAREVAQPSAPVPVAPAPPAQAAPAPTPSDNYVRARTPRSRETSGAQRAGQAGDKAEQDQRRRVRRGALQAQ